jgi:hypothetical protein
MVQRGGSTTIKVALESCFHLIFVRLSLTLEHLKELADKSCVFANF